MSIAVREGVNFSPVVLGGSLLDQPFFLPAAVLLVASLPLVLGVVPRNRWYGVRTRLTLSREDLWLTVNRWAGVGLSLSAAGYLAYAHRFPAAPGVRGVDLFHPHTYVFLVPLLLTALGTWGVSLRLGRR